MGASEASKGLEASGTMMEKTNLMPRKKLIIPSIMKFLEFRRQPLLNKSEKRSEN